MKSNSWKLRGMIVLWSLLVVLGFMKLLQYTYTPTKASLIDKWPSESAIAKSNLPTLLVFAHPQCPCSRATVSELARLMPFINNRARIAVVFYRPLDKEDSWARGNLWNQAQKIPGVETVLDHDGVEAQRFNAKVSGQTFLFNAEGNLVFSGGITAGRGHEGDSIGREMILEFFDGKLSRDVGNGPVFGCTLAPPKATTSDGKNENKQKQFRTS